MMIEQFWNDCRKYLRDLQVPGKNPKTDWLSFFTSKRICQIESVQITIAKKWEPFKPFAVIDKTLRSNSFERKISFSSLLCTPEFVWFENFPRIYHCFSTNSELLVYSSFYIREFKIYDATVAKTSLKIASSSFSIYFAIMSV